MRITSGKLSSFKLFGPGENNIRPTPDRIRQSLFNMISDFEGKSVLDLFAGTGSFGFEAASLGAARVVFVENYAPAISILKKNIDKINLPDTFEISELGALQYLRKTTDKFDFIFIDPPFYKPDLYQATLDLLSHHEFELLLVQHPKTIALAHPNMNLLKTKEYGYNIISFMSHQGIPDAPSVLGMTGE